MPPIDLPMKEDRRAGARERHGLFRRDVTLDQALFVERAPKGPGKRRGAMNYGSPRSRRRSATGAHIEGDGPTVFAHACKLGLEGSIEAPWLALPFWALARLG